MYRPLPVAFAALLALALPVSLPSAAHAADTGCPVHYAGGKAPDLINRKLAPKTRELCFREFAVLHSGQTRTGLYAAERLTAVRLAAAKDDVRVNSFHAEESLPQGERAELRDYAGSGYDRGHLAPSADMTNPDAQHESFSLANMIPQDADNNRNLWAGVEISVRQLARQVGDLYVVTGAAYKGSNLKNVKGRLLVPTHVWKAVYAPRQGFASAYVAPNAPGMVWQEVSIAELRDFVGIDPFPGIDEGIKARAVDLPDPRPYNSGRGAVSQKGVAAPASGAALEALADFVRKKALQR